MTETRPPVPALPGVTRYRKKGAEVEAVQWFRSGDHPADNCHMIAPDPDSTAQFAPFLSEGEIVRYYRNPDDDGRRECGDCGSLMGDHGWIDQGIRGRVVCPGDWVVSLPLPTPGLTAHFPVAADVFAATYEPASEPLVLPRDEFEAVRAVAAALGAAETITEAELTDEIAALKRSCRILANITARNHLVMEAARIEMRQNGPHAAMQWVLNSLPDVWDDDETAWDGKESAGEWFDRTEAFYRASERAADAAADPDPGTHPSEVSPSGDVASREGSAASWRELEDAVRERDTAEAKLARIAADCRQRLDAVIVQGPVSHLCRHILAITGSEGESRG